MSKTLPVILVVDDNKVNPALIVLDMMGARRDYSFIHEYWPSLFGPRTGISGVQGFSEEKKTL